MDVSIFRNRVSIPLCLFQQNMRPITKHFYPMKKLRRHSLNLPAVGFIPLVEEAVVETVVAGLPELQSERFDAVAAPE